MKKLQLKKSGLTGFLCAAFLTGAIGSTTAETLYVKRNDAELKESESRSSDSIATLSEGDTLEVIEKSGSRYKVKTADGTEGYISRLHVTDKKPKKGFSLSLPIKESEDLSPEERENMNAIRGLNPVAEKYAEQNPDLEAAAEQVKEMENLTKEISKEDLEDFMNEGEVYPQ